MDANESSKLASYLVSSTTANPTPEVEPIHAGGVNDGEQQIAVYSPLKFNFMRKFAFKVGKLSRSQLEELLVQKITEAMFYESDNTYLRVSIEKLEQNYKKINKRLEDVQKQHSELQIHHTRLMKDLKESPKKPASPVINTRNVRLQVSRRFLRRKKSVSSVVSTPPSEPSAKRKKTDTTSPAQPPINDGAKALASVSTSSSVFSPNHSRGGNKNASVSSIDTACYSSQSESASASSADTSQNFSQNGKKNAPKSFTITSQSGNKTSFVDPIKASEESPPIEVEVSSADTSIINDAEISSSSVMVEQAQQNQDRGKHSQ